jgi:hypothetical protein
VAVVTLPPSVAPVLDRYRALLEERAPGLVVGLHLHGSAALGGYVEGKSDLDFVAILSRRADARDVAALESIHRDLAREHPRPEMQGSYLQIGDLGRSSGEAPAHPAYSDG